METNKASLLYKFASLESAKKIILGQKLKFTNPFDFNDPFDCNIDRLTFDLSDTDEEFEIYHKSIKEEVQVKFGNRTNEANWAEVYKNVQIQKISKSKICSFSTTNDHPLLWSHYGDKHLGACLVFDNSIAERFKDEKMLKIGIEGPVQYKDFKKVNYCKGRMQAMIQLFTVKRLDWDYEKEYRIIALDLDKEFLDFERTFLKGIIFGMKVKNHEIEAFKNDVAKVSSKLEFNVAIKNNECLHILNWDFDTSVLAKKVKVMALSADPRIEGLFERLRGQ
jgi:hypothetical protein